MPLQYDPAKAHEYYIRTRQLKGRRARVGKPASTYTVSLGDGSTTILTGQQLAEQKAYAAKRVGEIKKSLQELGTLLRKAMRDAKEKKAKAEQKAAKPPTAAEKSAAARESKQYREKHKTELSTKSKTEAKKKSAPRSDPVAELETKITKIKDSLKAAVATQRALATATKNK
jgi:hypothetical protein